MQTVVVIIVGLFFLGYLLSAAFLPFLEQRNPPIVQKRRLPDESTTTSYLDRLNYEHRLHGIYGDNYPW